MRLFIAINLNNDNKDNILKIINELRKQSVRGNFTTRPNLHLTVVFIGEIEDSREGDIINAINSITVLPFHITISGLGRFKGRDNGDLYWLGISENKSLNILYKQLFNALIDFGFEIESREFKPHLTIGRNVITNSTVIDRLKENLPLFTNVVKSIDLMKSERINGILTYTKLYSKTLE